MTVLGAPVANVHVRKGTSGVRYLAVYSPTERAALQTADIARRLMRSGELHQAAATA
jgi:hypothetical protein